MVNDTEEEEVNIDDYEKKFIEQYQKQQKKNQKIMQS